MSQEILDSEFQDPKKIAKIDAQSKANINKIIIYLNKSIKDVLLVRNLLILMAVFSIIGVLINIELFGSTIFYTYVIESLLIAGSYLGCILSIKRYPKQICLLALIIFLAVQVFFHFIGFREVWDFLIIKIPVIYILIQGIRGALKIEKDTKELIEYGVSYDEINKIKNLEEISILP